MTDKEQEIQYISKEDLFLHADLIALRNKEEISKKSPNNPKAGKVSHGKWDNPPKNYTGLDDPNYGTAIRCDYIDDLGLYLVVIDLDKPKDRKEKGLPYVELEDMIHQVKPILYDTYSVKTPSGGVHIYLLSKERPIADQPTINLDYQTNTSTEEGKAGKYVIADYYWEQQEDGSFKKMVYERCPFSRNEIAVVNNADKGLQDILDDLKENHYIRDPVDNDLIGICKKYVIDGVRNNFIFALSGAFRKEAGYTLDHALYLTKEIFAGDEEITNRLQVVRETYKKNDLSKILGVKYIEENIMNPNDFNIFKEILRRNQDENLILLKSQIMGKLDKNQAPTMQQLGDYVTGILDLYVDLTTHKHYERAEDGSYEIIDSKRIVEFLNEEFGDNRIPINKATAVLKHITRTLEKDYDLVEFKNGMLNTKTKEFITDKLKFDKIPKVKLDFDWNPESEGGYIRNVIEQILNDPKHPDNQDNFMRAVGHAFMGYNSKHIYTILVGNTGTGKTTLITILQRLFTFSEVGTADIVRGERFTLYDMIDKDVNIDDDINNGMLKGIGMLNSVVSGKNLAVELKGLNEVIHATNQQTPRLFACGNTLPPVLGQGFWDRLCLIYANNKFRRENNPGGKKEDASIQVKIETGEFDSELEWFVYEAINKYWEVEDQPFPTREQQIEMEAYYRLQSNPLERAINDLYEFTGDEADWILETDVLKDIRQWLNRMADKKVILEEHRKHSLTQIRRAMDRAMFEVKRKRVGEQDEDTGYREREKCYVCIEYKVHEKKQGQNTFNDFSTEFESAK